MSLNQKLIEARGRKCEQCGITHWLNQPIKLEVHHIVPIEEDYTKRLDSSNLITLCRYHHEMAEANEISKEELLGMVSGKK